MASLGYVFPGMKGWIEPERINQIAADAALITTPNTAVPGIFTTYIDPNVVTILSAVQGARQVFSEVTKGTWKDRYMQFEVDEVVGRTQGYSDFANNGVADVNTIWPTRKQYLFETTIKVGDLELEISGAAKVNLAARKQSAAATILNVDSNKFALLGVDGMEIYGLLNDPNLNPDIAPAAGAGGGLTWASKTTTEIWNDIIAMFNELETNSGSQITADSPLKLLIPTGYAATLLKATDFNVSVEDMLKKGFPNIQIISLPELKSTTAGNTAMLIASEVQGQLTGEIGYTEKVRAFPIVRDESSFRQKWMSTTYGTILRLPFAVASMTGV